MLTKSLSIMACVIGVSLLGGCAAGNGSFSCDKIAGNGLGCATVPQTYAMTNHQSVDTKTTQTSKIVVAHKYALHTPLPGDPVRFAESVQRIWIAPFEDAKGIYHEPSYIYMVLTPSHWVGVPVKAVREEQV